MKEVVFHYVKKCTLVVANKTTLLHGKGNTFRSGHPEVAERLDQIPGKKARHGQTCQGFQHMEPSGEHDILSVFLWTALITILLFAVLKRQATYKWHFSNLVASLRLNTFTKIDLYVWINEPFTHRLKRKMTHRGMRCFCNMGKHQVTQI